MQEYAKRLLFFYWDTVECEDENCETSAEPEWRKSIQETAMGSLIWRFAAALTPPLLLIDSSLIPLICMLFPISKQTACLRLSAHCCLVQDIVHQLSVWYCNYNGQVITHEEPQTVIFLHGIWRHIKEFGIEGQIPRIPSPVKAERRCLKTSGS